MIELSVKTPSREVLVDITSQIQSALTASGHQGGFVMVFVPHTTAAVTINENADPDVKRDIIYKLNKDIPQREGYHHSEGNSDAHVKATLVGSSVQVLFEKGRLILGTWQGIYFCEFDGPRNRKVMLGIFPRA